MTYINDDKITIIGAGSWGTAIAKVIAENNPVLTIKLWARGKSVINLINETRENSLYLPGVKLPSNVIVTNNLKYSLEESNIVLLATPSKAVYDTSLRIEKYISVNSHLGYLSKGFCRVNNEILTISDTITKAIPFLEGRVAAIYGPSHAEEVGDGFQTCITVAGIFRETREVFVKLLSCSYIGCRETDDIKGVELGGALKNPAAIAVGMISILPRCGDNLSGALISEAFKEILKICSLFNVREETLFDISGLGDLITTSLSDLSRNRRFGKDIAEQIVQTGKSIGLYDKLLMRFRPDTVLEKMSQRFNYLAEGAYAIEPIIELADKANISIPVYKSLYEILLNKRDPELLIQTVKNPERFEEIFESSRIQVSKRKRGMEKARGTIFKNIIVSNALARMTENDDFKKKILDTKSSILNNIVNEDSINYKHNREFIEKECTLFKQIDNRNFERVLEDICKLYVEETCDNFNYIAFKLFVKYVKLINLKNILYLKSYGKRMFGNNIKISGHLKIVQKIINTSHVVYVSTYRSYYDFAYIGMAIDKYRLHVPRFFVDKCIINSRFKRYFLKLMGGYVIDTNRLYNPIYREITETYLSTLIEHGVQVLFFPELEISKDGKIGKIDQDFPSLIMKSLYKNSEEIALIPIEVSYYQRPLVNNNDSTKVLTVKNVLNNRARVNFSDPIITSDLLNTDKFISHITDIINLKWKTDSYIFPHYIFCRIIRENNYELAMDDARKAIEHFLQHLNMEKRYKAKSILKKGIEFIEKNNIGQQRDGRIIIMKKDDIDYYSNLITYN
ncbi:MAG: NAD(P)H-dependent glycerol-3-phosphate dehydrogenase [Spirochaetota bacterium]|nr:NAD(P)H-dependent glycerol-3-phosphate dehydrogenase [Spirochaetota bacterium]